MAVVVVSTAVAATVAIDAPTGVAISIVTVLHYPPVTVSTLQALLTATTKPTLAVGMWDRLDATPYGRGVTTLGEQIILPQDERAVALRKSRVHMDHYNVGDAESSGT